MIIGIIEGLENDIYTIRIGDSKIVYFLNRFLPKVAYNIINSKKHDKKLVN